MTIPTALQGTTFGIAYEAGVNEWGEGSPLPQWYPDMQITHTLSGLRHMSYTDHPGPRLRRHLLLVGPRGFGKSSSVSQYFKYAVGAIRVVDTTELRREGKPIPPCYMELGGKTSSWERLRGSVTTDGNVLTPMFKEANYMYASELFSFLGNDQRGGQKDMIDMVGQIIEEGHVDVTLIKLANIELTEKLEERLKELQITFDPETATLAYDADCTMIACTRYMNDREKQSLEESGFGDRFFISEWRPGTMDLRDVWRRKRAIDLVGMAKIKKFNEKMWKVRVEEVPSPEDWMFDEVLQLADEPYSEVEDYMGIKSYEIRSGRDHNVVNQLLTAAAWERTVREWDTNDGFLIPTIEYRDEDLDVAQYFFDQYVNTRYNETLSKVKMDLKADKDTDRLVVLSKKFGTGHFSAKMATSAFTSNLSKGNSIRSTYRFLDRAKERGWVDSTRKAGEYKITTIGRSVIDQLAKVEMRLSPD